MIPGTRIAAKLWSAAPLVRRSESKGQPVVLILGWGGSTQKNLKRVINWWVSELGCTTISHIMPLSAPGFVRTSLEREVVDLVIQEREKSLNARFLVHCFSNNGAWSYAGLNLHPDFPSADGIIYDSAPLLHFENLPVIERSAIFSRVLTSVALSTPTYHHRLISPLLKMFLVPFMLTQDALLSAQQHLGLNLVPDLLKLNFYLRDHSPGIPHLFLYSLGDELIPFNHVEKFVEVLKNRGIPCDSHIISDPSCSHVTLFRTCPKEYRDVVRNFLSKWDFVRSHMIRSKL
jgi:pimeloyl-ACP methyl ester carboxylesterase